MEWAKSPICKGKSSSKPPLLCSILIFQGEIQDNYLGKILMTNIHHFKVHEIYRGRLAPNKTGALVGYTRKLDIVPDKLLPKERVVSRQISGA